MTDLNHDAVVNAFTASAITTTFHGPTNSRGSRVSAKLQSGAKVTLHWDHALNPFDNHAGAVVALLAKEGLDVRREVHVSDNGNGYIFTMPVDRNGA